MRMTEADLLDDLVLRLVDQRGDWVTAMQLAEESGWQFKSVVWSLTRLRRAGLVAVELVSFPVPWRRGSGDSHYRYRSLKSDNLPQWLRPQALRKGQEKAP